MKTPLNIGLIGCGRVAERFYLPALSCLKEEARLVAVADPIRERRELFSSRIPGCVTFSSAEDLLQEAKIVAAIITSPPATHLSISMLALRAGIHVLVEKPLATFVGEVEELRAILNSTGGLLMVGFNRRYWNPVSKLRQIIQDRYHLDALSAQLIMTSDIKVWSAIGEVSDPLDDLGSHQLDLLRYIFDREIVAICARWIDTCTIRMQVRLEGGITAECISAHSNVTQESITIRCGSQRYRVRLGSERIRPAAGLIRSMLDLSDTFRRRLDARPSSLRSSFERQLVSFFNYISTGTAPHPGIADGLAVIRAVEAARRSAADCGMEVPI
jgi:predicted dehydrogenase